MNVLKHHKQEQLRFDEYFTPWKGMHFDPFSQAKHSPEIFFSVAQNLLEFFYPLLHTSRMFQHSVQSFLINHSFSPTVVLPFVFPRNVTTVFDTDVAFRAVDVNKQVTAEAGTKWHL